jgi:signal transduction histidine kinase
MTRIIDAIRSRGEVAADAVAAVGLTLFGWLQIATVPLFFRRPVPPGPAPGTGAGPGIDPNRGPFFIKDTLAGPLDYVLIAACFLPLTLRRRYPLIVLGIVTLASAFFDRFQHPPTITFLAPLIALYTVGTLRDRKTLVISGVLAAGVTVALTMPPFSDVRFFADIMRTVSMFAVAAALGVAVSNQRAYVAEVEARLEESERTREEEARRRVDEERLRIARELHDITAHSLSIIAVQAGAAERVILRDPGSAAHALVTIRETASRSLDELRSLVGVLRGAEDDPAAARAPREPQPSLLGLPDLVSSAEAASIRVVLDVSPDLGELPAFVDLSAFRIVQEALTNVVRHAEATEVFVRIAPENGSLSISVEDNGRGVEGEAEGRGHGISGMRERVAALDGEFEAGPKAGGGFRVFARLPVNRRVSGRE